MRYKIYSSDGSIVRCETEKLEYNGTFMGESSLSVSVKSNKHIDFAIGDYITYRGENFTLENIPTEKKTDHTNSNGGVYQYDSIKLSSPDSELQIPFDDFVGTSDTDKSFTAQPNFSFVAATMEDLAQRIQANLDRYYTGGKKWTIIVESGATDDDKTNMLITVSNISCWDAIGYCKSKYGKNFIRRGRTITMGINGSVKDITFNVGQYKGLYDMTRNVQSDQQIVTRLKSYGNTTNLNPRYYSLIGAKVSANITRYTEATLTRAEGAEKMILLFDLDEGSELNDNITIKIHGTSTDYTLPCTYSSTKFSTTTTVIAGYEVMGISGSDATFKDIKSALSLVEKSDAGGTYLAPSAKADVEIISGARKDNIGDLSHITFDPNSSLPNNMNIANLMLPSFPTGTLADWVAANKSKYAWLQSYVDAGYTFSTEKYYPYVNSKNITALGIRLKAEYFTTDDDTHKDIYPSLQYFQDDRNEIESCKTDTDTEITDSGIYADGATVPPIHIYIPDLGFEFDDVAMSSSKPKLHLNSGYCAGRDYTIDSWQRSASNGWILTAQRVKDDSIGKYFPYKDAPIKSGDKFVITDIYMPQTYIEQASIELLKWTLKWLVKNDYTVFSYSLSPETNFIKRHDDAIADKKTTFYYTVKEGDILLIEDSDMGISGAITIDTIKITEGDGILPKYDITLRDTKTIGSYQKIQQQIDNLTGGGSSSGYNSSQIGDIAYAALKEKFLSKLNNDIENGLITFKKGANFGENGFEAGVNGKGSNIDENGSGEMESLSLRKFLEVPELRYNRISIQVGNQWRAPGGGIIDSVTLDNNGLTGLAKLHLEDGEIGKIAVDDICMGIYHDGMTLSNNEASDYDDGAGNFKFSGFFSAYFRITEITDTIHNSAFKFSVRQTSDSWSKTFAPCAAMHFVCYGNFSDTTRQSSRYSTLKYERYLSGVNTWEFGERNIMAQFGDLSNLTVGGISMSGYSAYLNRIYMSGNIKQLEDIPDWMDVEQSRNGHMDVGQSEVVTIVIRDGYNRDVTSLYPNISLTRESGDEASDTSWNASHSGVGNPFTISFSDLAFTEERLSTLFNVKARKQDGKETNGAFNYSN